MRNVARSTRAWIETRDNARNKELGRVARSTRAWIETGAGTRAYSQAESHALRVRGLKPLLIRTLIFGTCRRTLYACVD